MYRDEGFIARGAGREANTARSVAECCASRPRPEHRLITRTGIGNIYVPPSVQRAFSAINLLSFVQYEADLAPLSLCR